MDSNLNKINCLGDTDLYEQKGNGYENLQSCLQRNACSCILCGRKQRGRSQRGFEQDMMDGKFDFSDGEVDEIEYTLEELGEYIPSAENGDYSPSNPWDAPGMKQSDFI